MWLTVFGGPEEIVLYVFAAVAALNVVLALAVLIVGCCFRSSTPGSSMDINIVFGGLALVASVLLRGIQIEWANSTILEAICQFHPALVTFGLLWFIGGLLMKVSAIFHFYRRHGEKTSGRFEFLPHLWLFFVMLIDAIIVLVWIFKYRPLLTPNADGDTTMMLCAGSEDPRLQLTVSVIHSILLILAAIIVWAAVHMARGTASSYETSLMSVIIYNTLFVAIAGALIYFFGAAKFDANMQYAIIGGLMNYAVFAAFLFLLIGKVVTARRENSSGEDIYDQPDSGKPDNRASTGSYE